MTSSGVAGVGSATMCLHRLSYLYAVVAQLVVQLPCKEKVGGSSPLGGTINNNEGFSPCEDTQ